MIAIFVRGLLRRRPEIDFEAEPLHGLNDAVVLDLAAREDRLLVTHDVSTIPPLYLPSASGFVA